MHNIDYCLVKYMNIVKSFPDFSQLYGSTTVVMAIYDYERHPSKPIEKKFGTIDYVIDLNNLAKFGFGKIFWD